ncbi:haloacid dehalogenase-like hydrolase [Bifidobacterium goeldii]|uniref:Haloacid dehalogenase-like hydrolase n=2 Tax=Bifidobacterium goeldii TaxID=2306975 RepID=A0A430FEI6_9BIFI|nr:haloacid dehalogenase-like hydrolase [Bifidobacterium goeldii]
MLPDSRQYDAVFFDLYGTLVDIRTDEESDTAWEALRAQLHVAGEGHDDARNADLAALRARFAQAMRDTNLREDAAGSPASEYFEPDMLPAYRVLCAQAGVDADALDTAARKAAWTFRHASTRMIHLYPGADDLLRVLKSAGLRVVLVSNAQSCYTRPELDMLGLTALFDRIVISSEESVRKPSPELFRRALEREGLSADRAVMIGNDERCDILGARSAGIDGIYLRTAISPQSDPQASTYAVQSFAGADYAGILRFLGIE